MKKASMIPGEFVNWIPRIILIIIIFIILESSILLFLARGVETAELENNLIADSLFYSKCYTQEPGIIDLSKLDSECLKLKNSAIKITITDLNNKTLKELKINQEFYDKNEIFCLLEKEKARLLKKEATCLTRREYILSKQDNSLIPSIINIETIIKNEK
jgi:hypothetical protein